MPTLHKLNTITRLPIPTPAEVAHSDNMNEAAQQTVRVRDSELDPNLYSPELGEFFPAPAPPNRENKKLIDFCVATALGQLRLIKNQKITN